MSMPPLVRPVLEPRKHSFWEDAQGLSSAVLVTSVGISMLKAGGLIVGGMVGVSLLLSLLTRWDFNVWFVLVNLPFYWLAVKRLGWEFTLKTFVMVFICAQLPKYLPLWCEYARIAPLYSAIVGGVLTGVGILMVIRHRASLGGFNIMAVYLQEHFGLNAGKVQLGFDVALMILAFFVLHDPVRVMYSTIGAAVVDVVLWFNHRPDRYLGR